MSWDILPKANLQYFLQKIKAIIPTKTSDLANDSGYTDNIGTITGITMNGSSKGTSGVVDLGTVVTDVSGKADKSSTVSNVAYDTTNKKITKTINGTTSDVVEVSTLKSDMQLTKSDVGLSNVGNFKAVSTVASQGLTDTEKSNARANIGAGTSSFSGSYNDLSNKPSIPAAANNGTLTIKRNGTSVGTFTANQSGNSNIDISVPTTLDDVSDGSTRKLANYLPLSGGTLTGNLTPNGGIKWSSSTALPENTNPSYLIVTDAFADGGRMKWANVNNVTVGKAKAVAWSGVTDKPSSFTPSSHTHGNIQNGGTLQTNDIAIANGDKLVVTDSSDSSKIARASISFDGSTATKCLTQKGTWETFASTDTLNTVGAINNNNKLFLIGTLAQGANPQSYAQGGCYAEGGKLYSNSKEVVTLSDSQALTGKTYNGYTLGAACEKGVATEIRDGLKGLVASQTVYSYLNSKFGDARIYTVYPGQNITVNRVGGNPGSLLIIGYSCVNLVCWTSNMSALTITNVLAGGEVFTVSGNTLNKPDFNRIFTIFCGSHVNLTIA